MVVIPLISDLCVYTMKTLSIFGTRPEAIQMALVIKGLEQRPQNEPICKQKAFQPKAHFQRSSITSIPAANPLHQQDHVVALNDFNDNEEKEFYNFMYVPHYRTSFDQMNRKKTIGVSP